MSKPSIVEHPTVHALRALVVARSRNQQEWGRRQNRHEYANSAECQEKGAEHKEETPLDSVPIVTFLGRVGMGSVVSFQCFYLLLVHTYAR